MKLIVDTNRVIAALVKNNLSRIIILFSDIELVSPEFVLDEIIKYKEEIISKAGIDDEEFNSIFSILFKSIKLISQPEYSNSIAEASELISDIDKKDVPFIALALAIENDGIWSDDKHLEKQSKIKIWKTMEILDFLQSQELESEDE